MVGDFRKVAYMNRIVSRREAIALLPAACRTPGRPPAHRFPSKTWESRAPESLGLNGSKLDLLARNLGGRGCVVRHGYVVAAWGDQSERGDLLSSAKPILSTLLFFAITEQKVTSVHARVADWGWPLSAKDRGISFWHLANMVSGYARPEHPGAAWAYNDYAIMLYQKTLFDRVFRGDPGAVTMHPRRLGALGLEDGLEFRPSNRRIWASVRDFARIAWFWLHKGNWGGQQILSRRFFEAWQKPQVPPDLPHTAPSETDDYLGIGTYGGGSDHFTNFGPGIYGFNWWFNATGRLHPESPTWPDAPRDAFMAIGAGGNCAVMIPCLGMVLVSARGNWGKVQAGNPASPASQHMRLMGEAAAAFVARCPAMGLPSGLSNF